MSKVDLSDGPPFSHQPGDATESASTLARKASTIKKLADVLRRQHPPLLANVSGEIEAPSVGVLRNPTQAADDTSRASLFAAGALGIYESARQKYNRTIDRVNEQWTTYSETVYVPGSATPEQADAVQRAVQEKKSELRGSQRRAEAALDTAANTVKTLLDKGPDAMSDPAVAAQINRSLRRLPTEGGYLKDGLRVLNLNVGGGAHNSWRDQKGLDPGDVPELADRILEGDTDVAALQEMFSFDAKVLERELEEKSGDDWTLTFSPASEKIQWGGGNVPSGTDDFGNVIAVRAPSDGSPGAGDVSFIDATGKRLTDPSYLGLNGGEGGDGRSMAAVTVETATGERVTIGTSQTDFEEEVSPEDQADQIRDFRTETERFADESGGDHVVLTGDLNHVIDEDHDGTGILDKKAPYYDVLNGWKEDYENAGDSANPGHVNGNEIDYIWTSNGLDYDNVDHVPGDRSDIPGRDDNMSDHDGHALDVNVPYDPDADANDPLPEERPGELPRPDELPGDSGPQPEPSPSPQAPPTPPPG